MTTAVAARRLLKFRLPPVGESRQYLRQGTRILAVGWQGRQLVAWTDHGPDSAPLEAVLFTVAMTGESVPVGEYIGTAQLDDNGQPYVVHVYAYGLGLEDDPTTAPEDPQ